ncbi:hypothetical protein Y032_0068g164 [Ancylostoma ceylanicum]|uniref:Uncharacterized protein n=1 Tax=Ancylostoma ceylanicum TaxID=53326 RepID=A0A016TYD5_9BILA|nr:hypothetical protein Y032_0068g164 [Ancylostoma ceylanicum]
MNQNEPTIEEIRVVEMIRIDCQVDRHGTLPNGAHRPCSRGCAQSELAMWVIAKMALTKAKSPKRWPIKELLTTSCSANNCINCTNYHAEV